MSPGPTIEIGGVTTINWDRLIAPRIQEFQVAVAETALKQAVAAGRFGADVSVITDGAANRDYHDVRPFGRIEFVQKGSLVEAGRWIISELERLSPVGSEDDRHPGLYKRSHVFLINGTVADADALDRMKRGDVLQIANTQPYAGKIEGRDAFTRWDTKTALKNRHGLTRKGVRLRQQKWSRRSIGGESSQAPNGVYRVVLAEAKARYGRLVDISYAPVMLNLGVKVWGQSGGRHARRMERRRILRPQVYPCFTIVSKALQAS